MSKMTSSKAPILKFFKNFVCEIELSFSSLLRKPDLYPNFHEILQLLKKIHVDNQLLQDQKWELICCFVKHTLFKNVRIAIFSLFLNINFMPFQSKKIGIQIPCIIVRFTLHVFLFFVKKIKTMSVSMKLHFFNEIRRKK